MSEIEFRSEITVRLLDHMGSDASIAEAARVSTLGEDSLIRRELNQADEGLINFLLRDRHGTPFEHNAIKVLVEAPITVFREWQRHRVQSYNEESGRYREMRPVFYVPPPDRSLVQVGRPGKYEFLDGSQDQFAVMQQELKTAATQGWSSYQKMLEKGIAKEVARHALTLSLFSTMVVTMNLRAAFHFLSLRRLEQGLFPSFPMFEIDVAAQQLEVAVAKLFPVAYAAFIKHGRVSP